MNLTLEQWGAETARELGIDPERPDVQQKIAQAASVARDQMPGVDDATIIEQTGSSIREGLAQARGAVAPAPAPAAPVVGTPETDSYRRQFEQVEREFSPEAERAVRDSTKWARTGAELGRLAGLAYRMDATPQGRQVVDQQFAELQQAADQPLVAWQEKKKSALARIEQQMKLGEIGREEVKAQLTRLGLEQALAERATAAQLAAAEADPNSATSEAIRALAREYSPEFVKSMGARFNQLTAAQLKAQLPALEKQYLKRLEQQAKDIELKDNEAERRSRETVANTQAAATVEAARIRANATRNRGAGGGSGSSTPAPAPAGAGINIIRRDRQGNESLDPQAEKAFTASDGNAKLANDGLSITGRMRTIINSGNASESDLGNIISRGQRMVGLDTQRRRADEALAGSVDSLIGILAKFDPRAKGAPSNADIQGIKDTINNPNSTQAEKLAALDRLEVMLNRQISEHNAAFDAVDERSRARLGAINVSRVGQPPAAPPAPGGGRPLTPEQFNAQWAKLPSGQSLVGPDGKTYTKR